MSLLIFIAAACQPPMNLPPEVEISAESAASRGTVELEAQASDPDGEDEALRYLWSSDRLGTLWTDARVVAEGLDAGTHTFTVQVTDAGGAQAVDAFTFEVLEAGPPSIALLHPAPDARYTAGDRVRVEVVVDDEEGDWPVSLVWSGLPDSAEPVTSATSAASQEFSFYPASVGELLIRADAIDRLGAQSSDSVRVLVSSGDSDGDGVIDHALGGADCDDGDAEVYPGADEGCDGVDSDCDGSVDEDALDASTWYADGDGDGYGEVDDASAACEAPEGYVDDLSDCDDGDAEVYPGADESCDGVDSDCDGSVDEDALDASTWHLDSDGDGYGSPGYDADGCEQPSGYADNAGDCDDGDADIYPGADEVCGGVDDDCDGSVDEGALDASAWYADGDGDGYGDEGASAVTACDAPSGHSDVSTDCDDADSAVHPGAEEICGDGVDGDCDGSALGCGFEGAFDVSVATATLLGDEADDEAGAALLGAALDGDDLSDVAVGAPGWSASAGAVAIRYGEFDGAATISEADLVLSGEAAGDLAGSALAAADIDGDGALDLLIGAPFESSAAASAGAAYLLMGPIEADASLGGADVKITGSAASHFAGWSLAAGDLDGDEVEDLVVGAPGAGTGSALYAGEVAILSGATLADADTSEASVRASGSALQQGLGYSLPAVSDVDGDGSPDLVAGIPGDGTGGAAAGGVAIWSGPLEEDVTVSDAAVIAGASAAELVGLALAAGEDYDGDGYTDLVVGATGESSNGGSSGAAYVIAGGSDLISDGGDTSEVYASALGSSGDKAGSCVAFAGDLDGDGASEIWIGAIGADTDGGSDAGAVYLVSGGAAGALDLADSAAVIQGSSAQQALGSACAAAGDVDGDGAQDAVLGASADATNGTFAGAAFLLPGGEGGL